MKSGADLLKSRQLLKHFVRYLVFFALLSACDSDERVKPVVESAYFPLEKGLYHVYSVTETEFTASELPRNLTYELMMEVVDSFPSTDGQYTHVIHRSTRPAPGGPWQLLDSWSVRKQDREIIVSEGDIPFVKMRFPIRAENRWDGNAYNSLGQDEYALKDINQPVVLNGMTFDKTLTVEQEHNGDVIVFRDERKEIFAWNVGLVYKEVIQLNYCTADHCLGQQKIDHGTEIKMVIREYGRR